METTGFLVVVTGVGGGCITLGFSIFGMSQKYEVVVRSSL